MSAMTSDVRSDGLVGHIHEWEHVLDAVRSRHEIAGGLRLTFESDGPIGRVAEMAVAENQQCSFFRFALTVDNRGPALEVAAPPENRDALYALFA